MNAQLTNADIVQLLKLWKRLFGTKMNESNWDFDTVTIWTIALNDLQMTPSEFDTAQRKSLTLKWPPTAPADFLELGRGDPMADYPEVSQAYHDQANFKTNCPIAYETAKRVGFWELRNQSKDKTYPQWKEHYKDVCIEHSSGKEFIKPQMQQIKNKTLHEPVDEATAMQMIDNIRTILAEKK